MKISNVISESYRNAGYKIRGKKSNEYLSVSKPGAVKRTDTIEISDEALAAQKSEEISATSGKDILGITRGTAENIYIVHLSDSGFVNRLVSRGYFEVNSVKIELSDDIKKKLLETDKQAEKDRMEAFNNYVMKHELAVAQQQSESWEKAAEDLNDAFVIATKISRGQKVTSSELKKLLKVDPKLYALAISTARLSEQSNSPESVTNDGNDITTGESQNGVDASQFEWKTYECQIDVTMDGSPRIESISEGEVVLNSGI